jgi:hypothetical protein
MTRGEASGLTPCLTSIARSLLVSISQNSQGKSRLLLSNLLWARLSAVEVHFLNIESFDRADQFVKIPRWDIEVIHQCL